MNGKNISDNRSAENISDKRLRIEVQLAQTNGEERVKHFVNVHLHCIVSNLKRISKISTLPSPFEKFLRTPMIKTSGFQCRLATPEAADHFVGVASRYFTYTALFNLLYSSFTCSWHRLKISEQEYNII